MLLTRMGGTTVAVMIFLSLICSAQVPVGPDLLGTEYRERLGSTVALSADGRVMAVGSGTYPGRECCIGAVRVYGQDNYRWVQIGQTILGRDIASNWTGEALALSDDGNTVVVTGFGDPAGGYNGYVQAYTYTGDGWVPKGQEFIGEFVPDYDRSDPQVSVSASGDTLSIGQYRSAPAEAFDGLVSVYAYQFGRWQRVDVGAAYSFTLPFTPDHVMSRDGRTVAIRTYDRSTVKPAYRYGVAVYRLQGERWVQLGGHLVGRSDNDEFGFDFEINDAGNRIALVSADFGDGADRTGRVEIYDYVDGEWVSTGQTLRPAGSPKQVFPKLAMSGSGNRISLAYGEAEAEAEVVTYEWTGRAWAMIGAIAPEGSNGLIHDQHLRLGHSANGEWLVVGNPYYSYQGELTGGARLYYLENLTGTGDAAQVPNGIRAYPNPSAKDVRFQVAEEFSGGTVQLLGSDGRAWRRVPVGQGNLTVEGVPPGVYTLLVRNASRYARLRFLVI